MSITSYLDKVREKPEHARRRFSLYVSLAFTSVIFVFWLASFEATGPSVQRSVANVTGKISSPGQALVAGVATFAADIWSTITGPKKVTISEIEILPGNK